MRSHTSTGHDFCDFGLNQGLVPVCIVLRNSVCLGWKSSASKISSSSMWDRFVWETDQGSYKLSISSYSKPLAVLGGLAFRNLLAVARQLAQPCTQNTVPQVSARCLARGLED